jgi:hypothetical protein
VPEGWWPEFSPVFQFYAIDEVDGGLPAAYLGADPRLKRIN